MAGPKSKHKREDNAWEHPTSYALEETAKEMWNAEDFVPAKRALLNKIREAGPKQEPYESPNWHATKELAAEFADAILPNNPTQAAAEYLGGKAAGSVIGKVRQARKFKKMREDLDDAEFDEFMNEAQHAPREVEFSYGDED